MRSTTLLLGCAPVGRSEEAIRRDAVENLQLVYLVSWENLVLVCNTHFLLNGTILRASRLYFRIKGPEKKYSSKPEASHRKRDVTMLLRNFTCLPQFS